MVKAMILFTHAENSRLRFELEAAIVEINRHKSRSEALESELLKYKTADRLSQYTNSSEVRDRRDLEGPHQQFKN